MQKTERLSRELLGLAGEYAVANELCRRGLYSQLTMGNHKRTDILIETELKMVRVQVKAKQGNVWPAVSGLHREEDFLVFVDFAGRSADEPLDFYIINFEEWKKLVKEQCLKLKEKYPDIYIDDEYRLVNPNVAEGKKPYIGFGIAPSRLAEFKGRWEKISAQVNPEKTQAPTEV